MATDDPFEAPDTDRTFIMPSPGQRLPRTGPPIPAAPPLGQGVGGGNVEELIPVRGLNPIIAAASPLLNAVPQLRASSHHPDPAELRETLARGIRAFETRAAKDGATPQQVLGARYVLCTLLDEMAASTPWGGSGVWGRHSLLVMFHNEAWGGEKVFLLLAKLAENPAANRDLLELMVVVLALGFEGRFRVLDNGRAQLEQLRERLYAMVQQQREPAERELSPHWKGLDLQRPTLLMLPMWAVFAVVGLLAVGLYLGLSINLNDHSDPVFAGIQGIRAKSVLPVAQAAVPLPPAPKPRLASFLAPEVQAGLVTVADYGDRSVITIRGDGFFEPGGTTIAPTVQPLMGRIAQALASVPGKVLITGHTDNQPIHTARFPSNWHLSQERADAVRQLLAATVDDTRLTAEGRADAEPVAGNATPAERARNRRVEITLFVAKPAA